MQAHARDGDERLAQRDEIARAGRAERGARDEAFEIVDRLQRLAQAAALGGAERELFDGVEAILDAFERHQRPEQPAAQHARAHRGLRAIEHAQQRPVAAAFRAFDHFEMLVGRRIDQQAVGALAIADGADVREVDLLRIAQVLDERAGGADGGRVRRRARSRAGRRLQLLEQRALRAVEAERPGVDARDRQRQPRDLGQQRGQVERPARGSRAAAAPGSLRRDCRLRGVFGAGVRRSTSRSARCRSVRRHRRDGVSPDRRTRRQRRRRRAARGFAALTPIGDDRQHERRLARVEIAGVGERAGRDDPRDLALDDALGLLRVFDLIADGDAEAPLDQPGEVAVGAWYGMPHIGMALPPPSFEREVSVSSSARAAVSASS